MSDQKITRRDFIKTAWVAVGGIVTFEIGALTLAYMQPRLAAGEFGSLITVGKVEDFPPGSITHIPDGRFYLARLEDGGFLAIYQRCTHLGCNVPWDQAAGAFICPCHNSKFTPQGEVLNPPAPRPLDLFSLSIENGEIIVDTGKAISRQSSDPNSPDLVQVVYP